MKQIYIYDNSSRKSFNLININEKWFVAFKDVFYRDFVIEFSISFDTMEDAINGVRNNLVYPNMSCKHNGK
jgi:hypothetical protein